MRAVFTVCGNESLQGLQQFEKLATPLNCLPCFLPQCLKWTALQCLSQYQLVVLRKKKGRSEEKKVIMANYKGQKQNTLR